MAQTIEHQRGLHPSKPAFPFGNRVLVGTQNPGRRPSPHAFPAQPQRRRHLADWRLDVLPVCSQSPRRPPHRGRTRVKTSPVVNRLIAPVASSVRGTTGWTHQRRWCLHRSSKTRQTIECKGKFSGLSPVPRWEKCGKISTKLLVLLSLQSTIYLSAIDYTFESGSAGLAIPLGQITARKAGRAQD